MELHKVRHYAQRGMNPVPKISQGPSRGDTMASIMAFLYCKAASLALAPVGYWTEQLPQ